jgi:ubiquinone/menaquinone biosynthesis C-methylase UbiE
MENYIDALKTDKELTDIYYRFSLHTKSEQQKQLEDLFRARSLQPQKIADIACGGGGTSFHLSTLYPHASYTLVDLNEDAVFMARESTKHLEAICMAGDIYDLSLETNTYDLVVCWQTLSWLTKPEAALHELIRICKPGGRVFASSLFNRDKDVDIYSQVVDHAQPSAAEGLNYTYNTYSVFSIRKWVGALVTGMQVHEFEIPIDLEYAARGMGTYTARLENGKRLQISGGMLMNWGILELQK